MSESEVITKRCSLCRSRKNLSEFNRRATAKDGRQLYCRECSNAKSKAWNKENASRAKANGAAWYAANKEKKQLDFKRWSEANRPKRRAAMARWRDAHPEREKAHNAVKNAIRSGKLIPGQCSKCAVSVVMMRFDPLAPIDFLRRKPREHWLDVKWLCRPHHLEADAEDELLNLPETGDRDAARTSPPA